MIREGTPPSRQVHRFQAFLPDVTSNPSAAAATLAVKDTGFNPVVVQKASPNGKYGKGIFWGMSPSAGTREPCGSTVTLYEQPLP